MTAETFRSNAALVSEMRELLNKPDSALAQAIVVLQTESPIADVPYTAESIVSVRALEHVKEREATINLLLSLAEPLRLQPQEESATWGVDPNLFRDSGLPPNSTFVTESKS